MPPIGGELGRGAEGVVYENFAQPGWVVKIFHRRGVYPLQARNEYANLENARAIRPDHVVLAEAPADPRQGWIVKERVVALSGLPDMAQRAVLLHDFQSVPDAASNLMWGVTLNHRSTTLFIDGFL